jgi:hypothetical protein
MKRIRIIGFFALIMILGMSGCAYTLRYTIASSQKDHLKWAVSEKTFAVENKIGTGEKGFVTESEILEMVAKSLRDLGWERAEKKDADYIFSVEFETEKDRDEEVFGFGMLFGKGSGFFISSGFSTVERNLYRHRIRIVAVSDINGEEYSWVAETTTARVNQKITTLAKHIIPDALSRFPEEGSWEVKKKVHLHGKGKER